MAHKRSIVLASSSHSRRAQLGRLGLDFEAISPDIDETPLPAETAQQLVQRLSESKARKVAISCPRALIIAGDQTAAHGGGFLTKPGSRQKAIEQLSELSGKELTFLSGISVLDGASGRIESAVVACEVKFRRLSARQIQRYVDLDEPFHAAGSFKAESAGIGLFEYMRSSDPSAITGMPLIMLVSLLEKHGYQLFQ